MEIFKLDGKRGSVIVSKCEEEMYENVSIIKITLR
jgi:hypothetical protein